MKLETACLHIKLMWVAIGGLGIFCGVQHVLTNN